MRLRLFYVCLVACLLGKNVFAADIIWDPNVTYTIPNDGNTWYIDFSFSLTSSFYVQGVLEVRNGGNLTTEATIVDGDDAVGGTDGDEGEDLIVGIYGTVIVKSGGTVDLKSGVGGNGAAESGGGAGGEGGDGGSLGMLGGGIIRIEEEGFFSILLSNGGNGGNGSNAGSTGGRGGEGGGLSMLFDGSFIVEDGGKLEISVGSGGDGGDGDGGGTGGDGGSTGAMTIFFLIQPEFEITGSQALLISLGSGGNGGNDVDNSSFGGDGGGGGYILWYEDLLVKLIGTSSFELIFGVPGEDGTGDNEGDGGNRGALLAIGKLIAESEGDIVKKFSYDDPVITLSQNLDIDFTWTITHDKTIFGNGNKLVLGPNGAIVLDGTVPGGGVTVQFDNLEIEGIDDHDIRCIDDDSTLSFQNVRLNLDTNYTFTKGKILIYGNCVVDGALTTFLYQSTQPLTIASSAELKLIPKTLFEYDTTPASLIHMTDGTSVLYLNNATLLATQPLTLATGVLSTEGLAIVQGIGQLSLGGLSDIIVRGGLARVGNVTL